MSPHLNLLALIFQQAEDIMAQCEARLSSHAAQYTNGIEELQLLHQILASTQRPRSVSGDSHGQGDQALRGVEQHRTAAGQQQLCPAISPPAA